MTLKMDSDDWEVGDVVKCLQSDFVGYITSVLGPPDFKHGTYCCIFPHSFEGLPECAILEEDMLEWIRRPMNRNKHLM